MSCVHIYAPQAQSKNIYYRVCFDCKRKSRFIAFGYANPFLGEDLTCLNCGRCWQVDDYAYRVSLPGGRGVADKQRKVNILKAKSQYRAMPPVSENNYTPNFM